MLGNPLVDSYCRQSINNARIKNAKVKNGTSGVASNRSIGIDRRLVGRKHRDVNWKGMVGDVSWAVLEWAYLAQMS